MPLAGGVLLGMAEDVPGTQPPLVREPRGRDLDLHRRFEWRARVGRHGPIAVEGGHGTFPVLLGVVANSLADGLELPPGQFRDERASGRGGRSLEDWRPRRHGRDSARRGSTAVRPPRGPDEETILGRQDRPLLEVGDLEREAARSGPNREDGPRDLLRLGVIGPDAPPSRGSHVEHAEPQASASVAAGP